jgi:hypothetical protein
MATNFEAFLDDDHAATEWLLNNLLITPPNVAIGQQVCSDTENSMMDIVLDVATAIV